jgi:hypothetical protein
LGIETGPAFACQGDGDQNSLAGAYSDEKSEKKLCLAPKIALGQEFHA